ncbi:MAG: ATP-binding cassette domain-containing protein [Congregibacter sp.]
MIILRDISLRRGERLLFEAANATLLPGQKIALTGANGCGKSSLFALLLGELGADQGEIEGLKGQRLAHMEQDIATSDILAGRYVMSGDEKIAALFRRLEEQEANEDYEGLAETHLALEEHKGYDAQRRVSQLMRGLGFAPDDESRALREFSGGWRVRLALAKALMAPSDVLLLDEPTNHLDLDTSLWLQHFLAAYAGTLLLISHDRDFIDACCTAVLHIEHQRMDSYRGGYSDFETQRAQRIAQQQAVAEKDARRRAEIEDFVRRFRAKATKARQAQSRLKELERMGETAVAHQDSPFEFRFPEAPRANDPLLQLNDASIGYTAGEPLLTDVNLSIRNGDRIALLGRNGVGKTTLLRSLCGEIELLGGERSSSAGCRVAYFDQQQVDTLDLDASALLHLQRLTPDAREQELRNFLGGFDFRGNRADATIRPFSGGEKARLALAVLAWQRPNVLVLDEPTNHLDLEMRRALELALMSFAGAVILVSHDRHLLRSVSEQLYRLEKGRFESFDDDLDAYEALILGGDKEPQPATRDAPGKTQGKREQRQAAAAARGQLQPLRKALQKTEKSLEKQQAALAEVDLALADNALYEPAEKARLNELLQQQGVLRREIETLESEWLEQQEQLEALGHVS